MPELGETLSERELDVLQCVVKGATNKEIAADLIISENTVKVHLRNIYTKLGVSSRTEAVTVALQQGMLSVQKDGAIVLPEETAPGNGRETVAGTPEAQAVHELPKVDEAPPALHAIEATTAAGRPSRLNWRSGSLVLLLLLVLGGTSLISLRLLGDGAEPTTEPFSETPIGDTPWYMSRPMPVGRAHMAVVAVGLDIYHIGGETDDGVVDSVAVYDTGRYTWREATAKPTAVADVTAAVLFGEIYVPGGRGPDGLPTKAVEVYSPANNAWRLAAALPQPVAGGLTLAAGGLLYLFGGWDGMQYLDTAYVYSPATDSWRPLPSMEQERAYATGGTVNDQLYVVGGFDGEMELATCSFFVPAAEEWSECSDMLLPRAGAGAAVLLGNELYVIGGGLDDDDPVPFSEKYDANSQTWQVVNTPMLEASPDWPYLGVTNVETRIHIFGGMREGGLAADNYVFAPFVYRTYIPAARGP